MKGNRVVEVFYAYSKENRFSAAVFIPFVRCGGNIFIFCRGQWRTFFYCPLIRNAVGRLEHHSVGNTVLFTWSRTSEMSDMGYGVRANSKVVTNVHHNIIGLNVGTGFDNTLGNPKEKQIKLDHNIFFLNKKSDVTATISPNIAFFKVTDDAFEDYADYDGIESLEGNIALDKADVFKGVLDLPYLDAFLSATYSETTDFDENSPANALRGMLGLNKQGSITTKVSMFCNRYPAANVLKLFGIMKDYGAQMPGAAK